LSRLTISSGVVGLNVRRLDLAVLDDEGVALAAVVAEDGLGIKVQVKGLGEAASGVTEPANL
jgi:hypothetical protein